MALGIYNAVYRNFDPTIGRWWGIDPKLSFDISPYAGMANNPVLFSDPLGDTTQYYDIETGELLGTVNNEGALSRVKIHSTIYGIAMEGAARDNMDLTDQSVANTFVSTLNEGTCDFQNSVNSTYGTDLNLIAFETGELSLSFTGDANASNAAQADGSLSVLSHFTDGSTLSIQSYTAIGGPYGNGSPPNGDYTVNNARRRRDNRGMIRDGVGFSMDLNPNFQTQRTLLRIHPDGNTAGTLGCVGLQCDAAQLSTFYNTAGNYMNTHGNMSMTINIQGNPNNHGGGTVNTRNIQE